MKDRLIEEVLSHRVKTRALHVLMKPGAGMMNLNQLAKVTGVNAVTLSRALKSVKKTGLVDYIPVGRSQLWRVVDGYPARILGAIFKAWDETLQPADALRKILQNNPPPPPIHKVVLFGSMADEAGQADSDIDLFLCLVPKKELKKISSYEMQVSDYCEKMTGEIFNFFGMNPSFLTKSFEEWDTLSKPLKENIEKGIVLYEENKNA